MVEAAWGATRKKEGYLKNRYVHLIKRKSKKKALVAIGHDMIKAAYFIIMKEQIYKPPVQRQDSDRRNRQIYHHLRMLKRLGLEIDLEKQKQTTI